MQFLPIMGGKFAYRESGKNLRYMPQIEGLLHFWQIQADSAIRYLIVYGRDGNIIAFYMKIVH